MFSEYGIYYYYCCHWRLGQLIRYSDYLRGRQSHASTSDGGDIFRTIHTWPESHPSYYPMGAVPFAGNKVAGGWRLPCTFGVECR
jgi:hypothetical protein